MLPFGDGGVVAFSHAYFDESGTHHGSRVMGLSGYWFDAEQARKFSRDWAKELAKFGLTAAHQTDCALGFGEYKGMPVQRRVEIQKALTTHIKRRSKFSVSVCMGPALYETVMKGVLGAPSAYTFLLLVCVNKVADFISYSGYSGRVAYFFEAGHDRAKEANSFMDHMARVEGDGSGIYHYAAHAFVDKKVSLPLQAADMMAWHTRHYFDRMLDGHERPRKDVVALTRVQDVFSIISPQHLLALRQLYARAHEIFGESLINPAVEPPRMDIAEGILKDMGLSSTFARDVRELLARSRR